MSSDRYYVKLRPQVERLWPADVFALADPSVLDRVWIAPADVRFDQARAWIETGVLFQDTLEVHLPGIDALSLSLGDPAAGTDVEISVDIYPAFAARIGPLELRIGVASELLRPVERLGGDGPAHFRLVDDARLSVALAAVEASFDLSGNVVIETDYAVSLPPVLVGTTGIVVEAETLRLLLSDRDAAALAGVVPAEARGLFLDGVRIYLPEGLSVAVPADVAVEACLIGPSGLSGRFTGSWDPQLGADRRHFEGTGAGDLLGIPFGLSSLSIELVDNVPVQAEVRGHLLVPYFDSVVDVRVHLGASGEVSVSLATSSESGLTLRREELLELTILGLGIERADGVGRLTLSGHLRPLLMGSDGLQWPTLKVEDLWIDSTGRLGIGEAWLDLGELATIDLWGFSFELSRIGVGSEGDRLWIDLAGSVRLVEQIPVGFGVEGFRISWPMDLLAGVAPPYTLAQIQEAASRMEVSFAGIQLSFGIPDAVEFEGLVRFFKDAQVVGFAGDVALRVPASGFAAEAGLLIGMAFEPPPFPFLYVYFGVDLPAGVPIAQSGLALKGAQGLFGLNVGPDKAPEENWYYDWYKRGPIPGAHPTNKWRPERGAIALGVGVTITTVDGVVKGTRGLLVLTLPGPVLIIEGRALVLSGLGPGEPPLRALAVFDGREHVVQFNIEAEAEIVEDLLEARGGAEAFFDLDDITGWHLHLGQDEPRERRIQGKLLDLLDADAFVMLDMIGADALRSRMGASVSLDPPSMTFGPVRVGIEATIEGEGVVTTAPSQLSGELELDGRVEFRVADFRTALSVHAGVLVEGPTPMKVDVGLEVEVDLPWPLDPLTVELELSWTSPVPPKVDPPVASVALASRFSTASAEAPPVLLSAVGGGAAREAAERSPMVPLDARPIVTFHHEMNALEGVPFAKHPDGRTKRFSVGPLRFTPSVVSTRLYAHRKDDTWLDSAADWTLVASSIGLEAVGGVLPMPGVWSAEADTGSPGAPASRRLLLWSNNPLESAARVLGSGYTLLAMPGPARAPAAAILEDLPGLMLLDVEKPVQVCFSFSKVQKATPVGPGRDLDAEGWRFRCARPAVVRADVSGVPRLEVAQDLEIEPPRPARRLRIVFSLPPAIRASAVRAMVQPRRRPRTLAEIDAVLERARERKETPDFTACSRPVVGAVEVSPLEWVITSETAFDCVQLPAMGPCAIAEVCELVAEEVTRVERGKAQEAANALVPAVPLGAVLEAGVHYRLEVSTTVGLEVELPTSPSARLLEEIYRAVLDTMGLGDEGRGYTQVAFFQTKAPPADLSPYVAWTSPEHQAPRVFRGDDLGMRFNRPYLERLYGPDGKGLLARVRRADGSLVPTLVAEWRRARSATVFPDEAAWERHRLENLPDWPTALAPDDVLRFRREPGAPPLNPATRYTLEVVADGRVCLARSFLTSRFVDFAGLVRSFSGSVIEVRTGRTRSAPLVLAWQAAARTFARARQDLDRGLVDHRYATLQGGLAAVEALRDAERQSRAAMEVSFQALAGQFSSDLYYRPFAPTLEVAALRARGTADATAFWLRAPESLDLRLGLGGADDEAIGRTILSLRYEGRTRPAQVVHDPECSQVILLPTQTSSWRQGQYALRFRYARDPGDEARDRDHRYDRRVESAQGASSAVTASIAFDA